MVFFTILILASGFSLNSFIDRSIISLKTDVAVGCDPAPSPWKKLFLQKSDSTTITLKTPEGETETFECDEDTYILDALEEAGIDHPYSCRAGACSSCAMKIVEGSVNQEEQSFLEDEQMEEGFVLTCVALPESDLTLLTEKEENILWTTKIDT